MAKTKGAGGLKAVSPGALLISTHSSASPLEDDIAVNAIEQILWQLPH